MLLNYQSGKNDRKDAGYFQRVSALIGEGVLEVKVIENPRIEAVTFLGNNSLPDSVLNKHFEALLGQQLNYRTLKRALKNTLLSYRSLGFALAKIDTCEYRANGEVRVFLDEGVVENIKISGNEVTKFYVIQRNFPIRTGDIFNYQNVKKGIQNIYGTDLFNTVRMDFSPALEAPELVVQVSEKKYQLVRLGGRYDNERKGCGFIQISNENIYGTGNTVSAFFEGGEKDSRMALQFRSDRIFKSFWTSQLDGYYKKKKYFSYNGDSELVGEYSVSRSGFDYSVGRQMGRLGTVFLEGRYNYLDQERLWGTGVTPEYFVLGTITLRSIVDTRDQLPFAKKGRLFQFYYQASSEELMGSEVSFYKLYSSLEDFFTIYDKHVVHTKLVWGTSDGGTPLAEQFSLGGIDNFYGLNERQIVGRHMVLSSFSYRYQVPKFIPFNSYLEFRCDFAGMWDRKVNIQRNEFLVAAGAKFSIATPLGPFAIAYGVNSKKLHKLYFSLGYDF